jgi:hypothetical protein
MALQTTIPRGRFFLAISEGLELRVKVPSGNQKSRQLPGPNDNTCPICLTEYCTEETLGLEWGRGKIGKLSLTVRLKRMRRESREEEENKKQKVIRKEH